MTDLPPPFPGPLAVERSALRTPDDVARMLQLHALGWGVKRIARELGCAKNTVKKYVTQGDWRPAAPLASVDTSNPATDRHRETGHHAGELRLVSGMR